MTIDQISMIFLFGAEFSLLSFVQLVQDSVKVVELVFHHLDDFVYGLMIIQNLNTLCIRVISHIYGLLNSRRKCSKSVKCDQFFNIPVIVLIWQRAFI